MSSNLGIDPVEGSGEQDKAEKGFREFVVASANAAEAFEASVGVFDGVTMNIKLFGELVGFAAASLERDARKDAVGCERSPQRVGIESAVGDQPAVSQFAPKAFAGFEVMTIAGCQPNRDGSAERVDDHRQLGVEPALGAAHRLRLLAACRIGAMGVNFDTGGIHRADATEAAARDFFEKPGPQAGAAPTSPARIDRLPWTKTTGQVAPWYTRTEHVAHCFEHELVVFGWTASAGFAHAQPGTPAVPAIRSIFLAASTAAR